MSRQRKRAAVLRLLRGDDLDALIGFRGGEVGTGSRSKKGLVRGRERG
jgi:hypothetical protein